MALYDIVTTARQHRQRFNYTAILAADITAAFDSVRFSDIEIGLRSKGIRPYLVKAIMNFISNRYLVLLHPCGNLFVKNAKGVPQGSCIGPMLWNLVLDVLLISPVPFYLKYVAYADDISVVFSANSRNQLILRGNSVLMDLHRWTSKRELQLSLEKTKILLLFKTANLKTKPYFRLGTRLIETVKCLKILGLTLDQRLNWVEHTAELRRKSMDPRLLESPRLCYYIKKVKTSICQDLIDQYAYYRISSRSTIKFS